VSNAPARTAVVLAASEGIGFACASALAQDGHKVAICSRSQSKLEGAVARIIAAGGDAFGVPADISSQQQLERVFTEVDERWGGTDILVSNTGGPPLGDALQLTDAQWLHSFRTEALPVIRAIRRAVPSMREKGWGRIITIGSISAKLPLDDLDLSNFVRAGLAAVHRTLARSLAPCGISVHMVLPGSILTPRSRSRIEQRAANMGVSFDAALSQTAGRIPMGRLGEPSDVGNVVAFLASCRADYLTGNLIQVDGGMFPGLG
jgi:3-oxoacyl-[acyl-carrier protein] reductase